MLPMLYAFRDDSDPGSVAVVTDRDQIYATLGGHGIRLEQVRVDGVADPSTNPHILEMMYEALIDRFVLGGDFGAFDFIGVDDDHPAKHELRDMFLEEHTHHEDEARLFLHGTGLFAFHVEASVYLLLCGTGQFIRVPAGMRHWFDMGPRPDFTALRLFNNADGWIPYYTGDLIASRFPTIDALPTAMSAWAPTERGSPQRTARPGRDPTMLGGVRRRS